MIKYDFKITLRNMMKYKGYSFINIFGLVVGFSVFILIMLFVQNELNYDKFNENLDNVYLLRTKKWFVMPAVVGPELANHIPDVQKTVRFLFRTNNHIKYDEMVTKIDNFAFADDTIFDIFTHSFIRGNPATALTAPSSIVLTESTAKKIFGSQDPMNKTIRYNDVLDFMVTGIIKDIKNSHLSYDALASFVTLKDFYDKGFFETFDTWSTPTYLLLPKEHHIKDVEIKINSYFENRWKKDHPDWQAEFLLTPLKNIYFDTEITEPFVKHGNILYIYIFIAIAIFILAIACVNFVNLSTARAAIRAKEIGIKKVVGSQRKNLIVQFLGESILITTLALILSIFTVELFLPNFNNLISAKLSVGYFSNLFFLVLSIGCIVIVGIASGIYPAFYLSSFEPTVVLQGEKTKGKKGAFFRKVLVIFQFFISATLIIGTFTIYKQLKFMRNQNLGFNKDLIVTLNLNRNILKAKNLLKEKLLQYPDIKMVSFSIGIPGNIEIKNTWEINGQAKRLFVNSIDPDYFKTMELKLVAGRAFLWDNPGDAKKNCILNESAVKYFGLDSPVGKVVQTYLGGGQIIGVVKDFHFSSLHSSIAPLGFYWVDSRNRMANIKISPHNIDKTIDYIKKEWDALSPNLVFEYSFLDESFDKQYKNEKRIVEIFGYFSILAIFIVSFGLFGLASYTAEQRTKEIGIRKVFGASILSIVLLQLKGYFKWVLVANLIAWPIAYLAMNRWLENFAYRINQGLPVFILSTITVLIIALIVVSYQSIKAASKNPVDSMGYQ